MSRITADDEVSDWASLVDMARSRAERCPSQVVLRFLADGAEETESLTFRQLDVAARAVAAELQTRGATGERVLLAFPPGLDFAAAFFGCLYAGAVAVPAYSPRRRGRDGRLTAIVQDARPRVALTTAATLATRAAWDDELANGQAFEWIATDEVPLSLAACWKMPDVDRQTLAFLQYTSGSTATPKGVMVSHGNLLVNSRDLDRGWEHTDDSVIVSWLPLFHDLGLIYGMIQPVYRGICGVLMPPVSFMKEPVRWLRAITEFRGTHSAAPNFAYDLCVERISKDRFSSLDLSRWRMTLNAAEPIRAATLERFAEHFAPCGFSARTLTPGYGLAECTLKAAADRASEDYQVCRLLAGELAAGRVVEASADADDGQTLVACGRSEVDTQIVIVDPVTKLACPTDRVGEIWVRGESVAQGYWHRDEETCETFQARLTDTGDGPFLRTGDLGFVLRDRLYVTGRIKDLIIIRGMNIYPQDIELTVGRCHDVFLPNCAAAFSVEVDGREELAVVQEVRRTEVRGLDGEGAARAIRRAVLDEHEVRVHALALVKPGKVPKTSSGKIQRQQCRTMFLDGALDPIYAWQRPAETEWPVRTVSPDTTRTYLGHLLAAQTKMAAEEIDPARPFADYGLDSLMAAELAFQLEEHWGGKIDPTVFWTYPNLDSLAAYLDGRGLPPATVRLDANRDAAAADTGDWIAVVGMGCRFPGHVDSPAAYWRLLCDGREAIGEIPAGRWDVERYYDPDPDAPGKYYTKHGGFLDQVDQFDAAFFRITPREAEELDPQQRLLLEVAWETLEDAAIPPSSLRGTETGIFIGGSTDDYAERSQRRSATEINAYSSLGVARSIAAGRIAYFLGTHGPAVQIDTACSSSLMAVHQACQSLRLGECQLALAGGVNLILSPVPLVALCKLQALAVDGRCKPFDARANGYVRGEGCGVVALKRWRDAQADGDRVLAVIRGSAANHDGASNGLTAPNPLAQERLLRTAVERAGVAPSLVHYLEAHGTGTELGDPIELNAIGRVYGQNRPADRPLYVGSVKAQIGHLEAAAGMAGLIKAVLVLQHGQLPGQIHFEKPNPHVDWAQAPLVIPRQNTPWPTDDRPQLAAVSSFGFSGTNVHLVLQGQEADGQASLATAMPVAPAAAQSPCVLPLSAKSPESLLQLASRVGRWLTEAPDVPLANVAFTASAGRDHHAYRVGILARNRDELQDRLSAFTAGQHGQGIITGESLPQAKRRIAFLFTGQGTLYAGMSRGLYESQAVFRRTLDRCHEALEGRWDVSLLDLLYSGDHSVTDRLQQTAYAQPALFAVQVALAEQWRSWGIRPAAVLGHSVGEYAAACVAGVFDLETGIRLLAERGRLMQSLPAGGGMTALLTDEARVAAAIEPYRDTVSIAAVNGPQNIVISGDRDHLHQLAARWKAEGVKSIPLAVSHAFHSPLIEPVLEAFVGHVKDLDFHPPQLPFISCLSGVEAGAELTSADYWIEHTRQPVQFLQGMDSLRAAAVGHYMEIGPGSTLLSLVQRCQPGLHGGCRLASLRLENPDGETMFASLVELYVHGVDVDWHGVHAGTSGRRTAMPTYPFQRRRFWLPCEDASQAQPPVAAVAPLPRPAEVAAELAEGVPGMEDQNRRLRPRLDEIALRFMVQTVKDLREKWQVGDRFPPESLAQRLPERHRPKLRRMLRHLIQQGLMKQVRGNCWIEQPEPTPGPWKLIEDLERETTAPEITLLKRAGRQLTRVLRGEVEALALLFPEGSTQEAAAFYSDATLFREYNRLAGRAIRQVVQHLPADRELRLLEIGAGTGGLTSHILPELPEDRSEYVFTDLSPLFLAAAEGQFAPFPCLRTARLDISRSPEDNGFEPDSFDIVLAANVLHATPRLRETLHNVRRLLKPGGWLVLLEGTNPPLWGDMIFALIDGWWAFQDKDLRPDYPLLPADRWLAVLDDAGFAPAVGLSDQGESADAIHTLFLAQTADALSPTPAKAPMPPAPAPSPSPAIERPADLAPLMSADKEDWIARIREHASRVMRMNADEVDRSLPLAKQGMDSLMMIELRTIVEDETNVELDMPLLTSEPSVEAIAGYLVEHIAIDQLERHYGSPAKTASVAGEPEDGTGDRNEGLLFQSVRHAPPRSMIRLQAEGTLPPLFFVPAGYGDNLAFREVANRLGFDRPVYGMQPPGGREIKMLRHLSIYQLVSIYLEQIKRVQPSGLYHIAGYSAGGIIAVELARELIRNGDRVALLAAIDPPARVPAWLDILYTTAYTVCERSRLSKLVRQSGGAGLRRMFHAVLDEGLRTHTAVVRGHQVESYPGRIIYFRARNSWVSWLSFRRRGKFWDRVARDGTEVHWVPGTHYGMLRGANADVLAEELRICLKRCATQVEP